MAGPSHRTSTWVPAGSRRTGFGASQIGRLLAAARRLDCARGHPRLATVEASLEPEREPRPPSRTQAPSASVVGIAYLSSPNQFPAERAGARACERRVLGPLA